jgi:hypothetical protein
MSSSSLPLSSSSDAILQPSLDPKQAVRPGHVASLGQSCSDRLEREPFGLAFPCLPSARSAIHRSRPCLRLPSPYRIETPARILDFSTDSASRHLAQLCLLYLYLHHEFHARTYGRIARTWPLSGSTHTRQSRISALSHSSFTYNYIISYLRLVDFTTARLSSLAVSQSL